MPSPWTPDLVENALVDAFRQALTRIAIVPVYASGGLLGAALPRSPGSDPPRHDFHPINWPAVFVDDKRERRWLMVRISNKARQRNGMSEFCREYGIVRNTFDRACERGLRSIARGLNAD